MTTPAADHVRGGAVVGACARALVLATLAAACGDSGKNRKDAAVDAVADLLAESAPEAPADAAADADGAPALRYSCGAFSVGSEWTTAAGFRSAVVAMGAPLMEPVAITFAGARFGEGVALVVDQGDGALFKVDTTRGAGNVTSFVAAAAWPAAPQLLTTVVWDDAGVFDRNVYVADQGSNADADSTIFRVDPAGVTSRFAGAPGPGLDDVYGLALLPAGSGYGAGMYVGGDTDGSGPGIGAFTAAGAGTVFATFAGVEGFAVDASGRFGGGLFAALPAGGGYSGDDTISKIAPDGSKVTPPLVSGMPGIHAVTFAPAGPFGGDAYAASWSSGQILRIAPGGAVTELAGGLALTEYDGNILAFSPDGRVLLVADRLRSRIVCIEPAG